MDSSRKEEASRMSKMQVSILGFASEKMIQDDVNLLAQLFQALEESVEGLNLAYKRKDYAGFRKYKANIIDLQKKISTILK